MLSENILEKYLSEQHMMQLATLAGDQPRCCTLYYVHDDSFNLYWASLATRRHSQEIATHHKVGAAIPIKFVNGEKVVGIQVEGMATEVLPANYKIEVIEAYAAKFGRDKAWVKDFAGGKTEHKLYQLKPTSIMLFDEVNFPDNPQQKVL